MLAEKPPDSPIFSLPLTSETAPRKKSSQFHRILWHPLLGLIAFNGGGECVFKFTSYFFIFLITVFVWGHDICVLIWALASSCHPNFNGAEQVHMPLSKSLRNHNQVDLYNGQIHISPWTCCPHLTKTETNACTAAHTSQACGEKEKTN